MKLKMSPEILVYDVKLGDKYSSLAIHVGLTNNSISACHFFPADIRRTKSSSEFGAPQVFRWT